MAKHQPQAENAKKEDGEIHFTPKGSLQIGNKLYRSGVRHKVTTEEFKEIVQSGFATE